MENDFNDLKTNIDKVYSECLPQLKKFEKERAKVRLLYYLRSFASFWASPLFFLILLPCALVLGFFFTR